MDFQSVYAGWLEEQRENSSPERRRRLTSGPGFAEETFLRRVWWPTMGHFKYLYPEYEVTDYSGASRFLDFAFLRGVVKLAIEIDGFTTHAQNIDRRRFAYRLHRQNMLVLDHWDVLRFSFDDVEAYPRRCQRTLQQYMGSRFASDLHGPPAARRALAVEHEIIRLARTTPRPISPQDVVRHLGMNRKTAYRHLRRLAERGWLLPASGTQRIRTYRLAEFLRNAGI